MDGGSSAPPRRGDGSAKTIFSLARKWFFQNPKEPPGAAAPGPRSGCSCKNCLRGCKYGMFHASSEFVRWYGRTWRRGQSGHCLCFFLRWRLPWRGGVAWRGVTSPSRLRRATSPLRRRGKTLRRSTPWQEEHPLAPLRTGELAPVRRLVTERYPSSLPVNLHPNRKR